MNKYKKIESNHKNYIIRVEGKYAFRRGDTFSDFEQVAERLQSHTRESLVYYWIRDSRLVKFAHTKIIRKIDEKLQYYSIKFSCIFGGQRFKSKANGLRPCKRQTRQIDCPAFISLRATKCGRKLEVIDVCNDHTHEISEQAVEELPQKRRPSQGLLEEIQELLHLNVDKKMIIQYVKQKENKNILRKDLFNMATHLRRTRSVDDQKVILNRIALTETEDVIQNAVLRRLLQFESDSPLTPAGYQESLKSTQNTLDVFDTSSPSAIDFTTMSPEINLLNTPDVGVKDDMEYHKILTNRMIVGYDEEKIHEENEIKAETAIYKDFICAEDTTYTYDAYGKHIPQEDVEVPNSQSPVSNHSTDIDDKELFNDLILISPAPSIYPADVSATRIERSSEEKYIIAADKVDTVCVKNDDSVNIEATNKNLIKSVKRKELSKYYARKTCRMIMKCRNCGTNARLIKMQISYLKQQRSKLFEETKILRLKKQKLKAEIAAIQKSDSL